MENERWTFGGRDRTPGLGVGVMVVVAEVVTTGEILTCIYSGVVSVKRDKIKGGKTYKGIFGTGGKHEVISDLIIFG